MTGKPKSQRNGRIVRRNVRSVRRSERSEGRNESWKRKNGRRDVGIVAGVVPSHDPSGDPGLVVLAAATRGAGAETGEYHIGS